ncbi:hypothetical protein M758_11G087300 [Ceratodon purpureus]|nr:hypothetical protein M758_11G087300 [Ceratodon purpureus]
MASNVAFLLRLRMRLLLRRSLFETAVFPRSLL